MNGVTTLYRYLGADLAAETDGAGNVTATYFYGPGVDQPHSRTTSAGTIHYQQDGQGSVTALTDGAGTVLGRYHYTPWGEGWSDAGMPVQPLRWTARELDETGLYYLRGRYYLLGRLRRCAPTGSGEEGQPQVVRDNTLIAACRA